MDDKDLEGLIKLDSDADEIAIRLCKKLMIQA